MPTWWIEICKTTEILKFKEGTSYCFMHISIIAHKFHNKLINSDKKMPTWLSTDINFTTLLRNKELLLALYSSTAATAKSLVSWLWMSNGVHPPGIGTSAAKLLQKRENKTQTRPAMLTIVVFCLFTCFFCHMIPRGQGRYIEGATISTKFPANYSELLGCFRHAQHAEVFRVPANMSRGYGKKGGES